MSLNRKIALSATAAIVIGSSSLYAESNTTIPQIPNEINVSIINNNTGSTVSALPPSIQLNAVDTTIGVNKNKKLGLHLNSVNMATVTLQSDSSVKLIQETDFLYAKFAKSGLHTITAIGKAINGTDINATVTFDVINRTPISNSKTFAINANEILKFDAYTYFLDEDDENLTFNKASLPAQGTLELNSNRVTYYTQLTDKDYNTTFNINATDIDGASIMSTFNVFVSAEAEKIDIIDGWNLLGNSAQRGINVSNIASNAGDAIWTYINGTWSNSTSSIQSKQGFWLDANGSRKLSVILNSDATVFSTYAPYGWKLKSDTEEKTLKRLKFGNDAVWTYKDSTWFNANNYPDYEVSRYSGFWTQGEISEVVLSSCKAILDSGRSTGDGIYTINPEGNNTFDAYCDMTTDGGGWTLVKKMSNPNSADRNGYDTRLIPTDYTNYSNLTATDTDASLVKFMKDSNLATDFMFKELDGDMTIIANNPVNPFYNYSNGDTTTYSIYLSQPTDTMTCTGVRCADWEGGSNSDISFYATPPTTAADSSSVLRIGLHNDGTYRPTWGCYQRGYTQGGGRVCDGTGAGSLWIR